MPLQTKKPIEENALEQELEGLALDIEKEKENATQMIINRENEIIIRLQELDYEIDCIMVKMDSFDYTSNDEEYYKDLEKLDSYKNEYKALKKEMKQLSKQNTVELEKNDFWSKTPLWMYIFTVLHVCLGFFLISPILSLYIAEGIASMFKMVKYEGFTLVFPVILIGIASLGFIFSKTKKMKLTYLIFYSIQVLNVIASIIFLSVIIWGN